MVTSLTLQVDWISVVF